jgi:hypothetical protein
VAWLEGIIGDVATAFAALAIAEFICGCVIGICKVLGVM